MASARYGLGVTRRQAERVRDAFRQSQWLYVIPYNAPWYELLLSKKLMIQTASGEFGVKTGSVPKKHSGWVGFYNSKARVRKEVVERHGIDPHNLNLGMLVGVGYLQHSRKLTPAEKYQWYLRANKMSDADFNVLYKRHVGFDPRKLKTAERVQFLFDALHDFVGSPLVIAGPMNIGHFYRPESLMRFSKPIPIKYPSGPVTGTNFVVTPDIRKALQEVGVTL